MDGNGLTKRASAGTIATGSSGASGADRDVRFAQARGALRAYPRILVCALCLLCVWPAGAQELIVNGETGIERLTRNEARLYLTMRLKRWPNGTQVKLFVLPDNDALHVRVVNSVLGLYPYQLRRAWDRQLFSGTGQAPVTVSSVAEMLERVAGTPGALGYVGASVETGNIRTLEVQ